MERVSQAALTPADGAAPANTTFPLTVVTILFFMWGLLTSLNDVLIPHLKAVYTLNYVQAMLVQFCFFGAYFIVSLPAGMLIRRIGYQRGAVAGLVSRPPAARCSIRPPPAATACSCSPSSCWPAASPCCRSRPTLRRRARRAGDGIEPPEPDPGLQLARHHAGAGTGRHADPVRHRTGRRAAGQAAGRRTTGL
jgi:hypothetical protein